MFNHDQQFFAPLDRQEQEEARADAILSEFYHRNPQERIKRLLEAVPSYAFTKNLILTPLPMEAIIVSAMLGWALSLIFYL